MQYITLLKLYTQYTQVTCIWFKLLFRIYKNGISTKSYFVYNLKIINKKLFFGFIGLTLWTRVNYCVNLVYFLVYFVSIFFSISAHYLFVDIYYHLLYSFVLMDLYATKYLGTIKPWQSTNAQKLNHLGYPTEIIMIFK